MAEGATTSLKGLTKQHIADFVHGTDGFGNTSQAAVEVRGPSCAPLSAYGERNAAKRAEPRRAPAWSRRAGRWG